jgi:hypothetical protein
MTTPRVTSIALSTCIALGMAVCLAPAASAAELTVTDPARDNAVAGLDLISSVLQNNDYTVAGTVSFRADRDGTLIVGLKARDRGLVRVVSRHQAGGGSRSFLLDADGRIVCDGLAVSWHNRSAVASFSVPSTCLWEGNYGAVRPWFLTEGLDSGVDVDFSTTTTFVPRG